jgi:hypothetical protein
MIQLHVDLSVLPARATEFERHFADVFRPAAAAFEGYIDVRLLKFRAAPVGQAPPGLTYRFALVYQSEELRQKWVTSAIHNEVWTPLERMLAEPKYDVLLFDVV